MASAVASANNFRIVSRASARDAIRQGLRLFVGRGRRYSVKQLSNGSGVPDRLIECAMCDGDSVDYRELCPGDLLSLSSFLGEAFTTEWLKLAKQGAFALPDEDIPSPGEIVADCAEDTAEIADAARDGDFDQDDQQALRDAGHSQIERGMTLLQISTGGRRRKKAA